MTVKTVADTSPAVAKMQPDWSLVDALLGGTRAMRDAGQLYLPKRTLETTEDYEIRRRQATLFPAFAETIGSMAGRVFSEPMAVNEAPAWIDGEVIPDVDMQGRNLHVFARDWFRAGLVYGLAHVLIEAPPANGAVSQADQRRAGMRPYLIPLKPDRILGWREQGGKLQQLRVKFAKSKPDGDWGESTVEQVRVYEPRLVRVFERNAKEEWVEVEQITTGFAEIPLLTFYTGRTGFLTAEPPLRELAHLNVKHWAQQSSVDSLLETACVPILAASGVDDGDAIVIGAKHAVRLPQNGRLEYVEHTGAAIGAGRVSLDTLKDEMRQAGAKLLAPQAISKTATQAGEEAARENSALGAMVQDFEDAIDALLDAIAATRGDATGGRAKMNANLDPDIAPTDTMNVLLGMRNAGMLSDATVFTEAQRRGLLRDDIAWEDEQQAIAEQSRV